VILEGGGFLPREPVEAGGKESSCERKTEGSPRKKKQSPLIVTDCGQKEKKTGAREEGTGGYNRICFAKGRMRSSLTLLERKTLREEEVTKKKEKRLRKKQVPREGDRK